MSQQPGQQPEDDQRRQHSQHGGHGYNQGEGGHSAAQQYGYDSQYAQHQDQGQYYGDNQGGYAHDPANAQGQQAPSQNYGQYGYEQGYGQGGYDAGYAQGQEAPGQSYHQNYSPPGGGQPGYGYDQGGYGAGPNYGAAQPGYPADPGYLPPAVQTGARAIAASLILDDGSNRHYPLVEGSNVVGRGQDAQFRLPDTGVSRRHLEITWDGWTATLADLGSTNGTTVNGTPVQTWQLADGDVVRVGHSALVFRTQG